MLTTVQSVLCKRGGINKEKEGNRRHQSAFQVYTLDAVEVARMSGKAKKYIFVNGVMKKNPDYHGDGPSTASPSPVSSGSKDDTRDNLAVVCSMSDIETATKLQAVTTGAPMQISEKTSETLMNIQEEEYLESFHAPSGTVIDGGEILDKLSEYFVQYEVPVGMLTKLLELRNYRLNFLIDDSGSMRAPTDVFMGEACVHTARGQKVPPDTPMTRWQEAENRLHILLDIIAYVPTQEITIGFLNAKQKIKLSHQGKTIEQFQVDAHAAVVQAFSSIDVKYKTPTHRELSKAFAEASRHSSPTMHYFMTDGVPSDQPVEAVASLIQNRAEPHKNPLTLMSCTNEDQEVEWMKEIEESAPYVSELDDFNDEKQEVVGDQGSAFPFTKGFWLVSQLVAAINPDDLDAIDENLPFTKYSLDNMLGRKHTPEEYHYYFERNPHAHLYVDVYPKFLNDPVAASAIVSKRDRLSRESKAGYIDGKKPAKSTTPSNHKGTVFSFLGGNRQVNNTSDNIGPLIQQHTKAASDAYKAANYNPDSFTEFA